MHSIQSHTTYVHGLYRQTIRLPSSQITTCSQGATIPVGTSSISLFVARCSSWSRDIRIPTKGQRPVWDFSPIMRADTDRDRRNYGNIIHVQVHVSCITYLYPVSCMYSMWGHAGASRLATRDSGLETGSGYTWYRNRVFGPSKEAGIGPGGTKDEGGKRKKTFCYNRAPT